MSKRDYYEILEVSKNATPEEMSIYQEQIKLFRNNEGNVGIIEKAN